MGLLGLKGKIVSLERLQAMSTKETRKRLAALSFSDKVNILEKLRKRSLAIAASGLRRKTASAQAPARQDKTV